jgi:hypothetical protein
LLFLQMKIVKTHEKHNLERGAVFCGRIQNLSLLTYNVITTWGDSLTL